MHRTTVTVLALAALAVGAQGCSKKRSSSSFASTAAATQSSSTTTTTSSANTGGATPAPVASTAPPAPTGPVAAHPGSGVFTDGSLAMPNTAEADWTVAAADLDGDRRDDLVFGVYRGPSRVLLNKGGKLEPQAGALPALSMAATDVHAVDMDKDGDLDLVFAANFEPVRVFKNSGAGRFTLGGEYGGANPCFTYKVAVGDVTGDGYADVFMANSGQNTTTRGQNRLLVNDRQGGLVAAASGAVPARADDSIAAALLDVNGDAAQDVLVVNFGSGHRLLVNDGAGRFVDQTDAYLPAGLRTYGTSAAIGDLNGDGRADIVIGNQGAPGTNTPPPGEKNTVLLRSATTRFVDASALLPDHAESTFQVRLVDVDGDRDLDLVCANLRAVQRLYLNDGGAFVDVTATHLPPINANNAATPSESLGVAVGDLDGDKAPDLVFPRRGQKPWLFLNTPAAPRAR